MCLNALVVQENGHVAFVILMLSRSVEVEILN